MGSEWPKQEKGQQTINSKWAQHDKCHLYYLTLTSDQSGPELRWHFWMIRPADFRFGRYRYSVKLIPVLSLGSGGASWGSDINLDDR